MLPRCAKFARIRRNLSYTRPIYFNNYQELGSDELPARSFINSLFCQQLDIDWLNVYPTLPKQEISNLVHKESEKLSKLIGAEDSLETCLDLFSNSIILDVGVPAEYGGYLNLVGTSQMLQATLSEGIGDNLLVSRLYALHCASLDLVLRFGNYNAKEIVCLDSIAGIITPISFMDGLVAESGLTNGSLIIQGACSEKVSNVVVRVQDDENEYFILVSKFTPGIILNPPHDEFENCVVEFRNVQLIEDMKLSSNSTINFASQVQYAEDSYNLIISAAVLGCLKRLFNSALELLNTKTIGLNKVIKTDLGKTIMAQLQIPLYEYESAVYSVAGKRHWSSENLSSEIMAIRTRSNNAAKYMDDIGAFLGNMVGMYRWDLSRQRLRLLSSEYPNHICYSMIGLRGFQAQIEQSSSIAKRLSVTYPLSREWRRLKCWQWNWDRSQPELVSFGWSSVNSFANVKITTTRRQIFKAVKDNLVTRTKKDGVGTWAPEDMEVTKRTKFSYEFAMRDFCHAVYKHGKQYGSTIPTQEWIVHDFGKTATHLFLWATAFSRQEKSHMSSIRGFESERDLAGMVQNDNFEAIVTDINYATSTWYFNTAAPHGKQRAIDDLILGENLLNTNKV